MYTRQRTKAQQKRKIWQTRSPNTSEQSANLFHSSSLKRLTSHQPSEQTQSIYFQSASTGGTSILMANTQYSAQNFAKQMKEIADKMGKRVEDVAEESTKELFRTVIEETPVGRPETWKTKPPPNYVPGKAKANWMPSAGAPDTTVTESRESSVSRLTS